MQRLAMSGQSTDRFPKQFWDEVMRREGCIDPVKYGLGCTGAENSPNAYISGRKMYKRIFIRLKTPQETLTCSPIRDGEDFAQRVSIIEHWFNSVTRDRNLILTFEVVELTNEEADDLEQSNAQ